MLFDSHGARKYVCARERRRFLAAAKRVDYETELFCRLMLYSGARISEALSVTPLSLDRDTERVIFRTLKRRKLVYRAVPLPRDLMAALRKRATRCGHTSAYGIGRGRPHGAASKQ
jgi:integrase